jgi:hypothetical protein
VQRLEHRQVGGGAGVAGVRREVEQHHRDLALGALRAAQRHQPRDARGQGVGALGAAGACRALVVRGVERAACAQPVQACPARAAAAAEHHRAGGAVELGDRDHHRGLHRQQAAVGAAPLVERLELDRVRREVGHVEPGQHSSAACASL